MESELVDRVTGKRHRKPSESYCGWSELQRLRAIGLYRLLTGYGANLNCGLPLLTADLAPFVNVADELFGERLKEFATTLEIENAYGYSYEPAEDETQAGRIRALEREVALQERTLSARGREIQGHLVRIDELSEENRALRRVVDGRAAIAEAEPAFAAVERALEPGG